MIGIELASPLQAWLENVQIVSLPDISQNRHGNENDIFVGIRK